MTAGRGVIHSEMPEQKEGLLHGFQLWVNLPAKEKMKDPHYQEYKSSEFPIIDLPEGGKIKVIAGSVVAEQNRVEGLVSGVATSPLYLDITLSANEGVVIPVPESHTALVYVFDGATDELDSQQLGVYEQGVAIALNAGAQGARLLLVAAQPLREPVVQYGPFVMNTMEEVEQALSDYRDGKLTT
nr:putative pirin-like protein [uncultured bacterium]